jgi:hypothetical protein
MVTEKAIAARLLVVVQGVYEGGRAIIGERWSLLRKMKEMADRDDVIGMVRYFEECLRSDRGRRVAEKLHAAKKKTLETEAARIWAIVSEALIEAKIDCVTGVRDVARLKRLHESFDEYWKRESLTVSIDAALRGRLQGGRGVLLVSGLRPRLNALPFIFLRHTGPGFDRVRHLLRQATEAYLLGLFEASAVVGRASLESALAERWDARQPLPGGQTGRLALLILACAQGKVITETQTRLAGRVKQAGDRAAHGEHIDASQALAALAALRRFIGEA